MNENHKKTAMNYFHQISSIVVMSAHQEKCLNKMYKLPKKWYSRLELRRMGFKQDTTNNLVNSGYLAHKRQPNKSLSQKTAEAYCTGKKAIIPNKRKLQIYFRDRCNKYRLNLPTQTAAIQQKNIYNVLLEQFAANISTNLEYAITNSLCIVGVRSLTTSNQAKLANTIVMLATKQLSDNAIKHCFYNHET